MPPSITSLHLITQAFCHLTLSQEEGRLKYNKVFLRERKSTFTRFITIYCYNYSTLVLVIINFLLCLIYKLNFIVGMYYRKKHSIVHIQDLALSMVLGITGDLGRYSPWIKGDYCTTFKTVPGSQSALNKCCCYCCYCPCCYYRSVVKVNVTMYRKCLTWCPTIVAHDKQQLLLALFLCQAQEVHR